jgi:hypothetical protein
MATITALLMSGAPHPYDGGLWGDFSMMGLEEGDRAVWVWITGGSDGERIIEASPRKLLEPALDVFCSGSAPQKLVLAILAGSSLRPRPCARTLEELGIPFEVLTVSASGWHTNPFDEKNPSEEG